MKKGRQTKSDPKQEFRDKMTALVEGFIRETDEPEQYYWTPGVNLVFVLHDFLTYYRDSLPDPPKIYGKGHP